MNQNKSVRFLTLSILSLFALCDFSAPVAMADSSLHSAAPHSAAPHSATGVAPATVLKDLKDGNQRFLDQKQTRSNQDPQRRKELAKGQTPSAIVLSCSDSRVPPELIFDKGLGELFVVRVAGNVLGASTVASMEYAVEHLGARLIVVMGHESCGAVKAAITTPVGETAGSADLDTLVASIQPFVKDASRNLASTDPTLRKPVMQNVNGVADRLMKRSTIIRKGVEEGKVQIVRAIYGLETGKVDFWSAEGSSH